MIELLGPNIVTTYNVLSPYIAHLRNDDRHGKKRVYVYEHFEKFAKEILLYKNNKFGLKIVTTKGGEEGERNIVPFPMCKEGLQNRRPRVDDHRIG